jgi:hypothetical protein
MAAGAALLAAWPAAAAERGYTITSFDRVRVEGPFAVTVATGKAPSARASGSADALERVQLRVEGRTLIVRPNMSAWGGFPDRESTPARISVSTQAVQTALLLGSGRLEVDRMKGARTVLTVEGSGRLAVGMLDADVASLAAAGSGGIEAAGRAKQASVIARGAAEVRAPELIVSDLTLTSETAGAVALHATRSARVTASGLGAVQVNGNAACEVRKLGAGTLSCGR